MNLIELINYARNDFYAIVVHFHYGFAYINLMKLGHYGSSGRSLDLKIDSNFFEVNRITQLSDPTQQVC